MGIVKLQNYNYCNKRKIHYYNTKFAAVTRICVHCCLLCKLLVYGLFIIISGTSISSVVEV